MNSGNHLQVWVGWWLASKRRGQEIPTFIGFKPIGSVDGIFTYIYHKNNLPTFIVKIKINKNVSTQTIHGSFWEKYSKPDRPAIPHLHQKDPPSPRTVLFSGREKHRSPKKHLDVSKNSGTPKSSILIGFSIINHPFWGTPIFGNTRISWPW